MGSCTERLRFLRNPPSSLERRVGRMEPRDEHDDDVDNESESSADGTRRGSGIRREENGACVVSKGAGAGGGVARGACPVENDEQRLRSFFHRCDSVLFHAPRSVTIS